MSEHTDPGLFRAIARYWRMSLAIILGMTALSAVVAGVSKVPAQVSATIGLIAPRANNVLYTGVQGDASLARYTTQRARFVTSDAVIGTVASKLDRDLTALREDITATASANSNVITVLVTAADSESAVALAQAVVDSYRTQTALQVNQVTDAAIASLKTSADEIRAQVNTAKPSDAVAAAAASTIGQLQTQAADLETSRALTGDGVEFVVAPRMDSVITPSLPLRELALGFLVGLAIAASAAWIRADRHRQLSDGSAVAELLEVPCLGEVPKQPRHAPLTTETISHLPTHDHQLLWTAVSRAAPPGVIVLESVGTDAPAWTAVNLAAAGARQGFDVLVVDADMQYAQSSHILGRERGEAGLAGLLTSGGDCLNHVVTIGEPGQNEFFLVPAGPVVDEIDLHTSRLHAYVEEWRRTYDYVLIATQPTRESPLATNLAEAATGLLVVVGHEAEEEQLLALRRYVSMQGLAIIGFAFSTTRRAPQSTPGLASPQPSSNVEKRSGQSTTPAAKTRSNSTPSTNVEERTARRTSPATKTRSSSTNVEERTSQEPDRQATRETSQTSVGERTAQRTTPDAKPRPSSSNVEDRPVQRTTPRKRK